MHEVAVWANAQATKVNQDAKALISESGISEIITLTPGELAGWRQAMQPVWDQFSDTIGADLIAAAEAMSE